MNSNEIEQYKKELSLSERQKQILSGCLLGDGHLESQYRTQIARLKVEHSYKQREYVDWLYQEFKEWIRQPPQVRKRKTWGKVYKKYYFTSLGHPELAEIRKKFYSKENKVVPKNFLKRNLGSMGLAVWYMDDGSIKSKKHKGVFLNTQSFREQDIDKLQEILEEKFDIVSTTRKDKNGKQIYLGSDSGERFIRKVSDNLLPHFAYKIPRPLRLT